MLKMSVSYSATMDGEIREVEDILTPSRIPRQRRHLWGGTMVMADVRGERKVVDFMSTFQGEWFSDMMVLHRRDEISFLADGVRKLRSAGVVVTLDGDFGDIMSDKSMRLSMDLSIKSGGIVVFAKPLVGDQDVDLMSLEDAVRKGKQWVVSDGKVVRVEDGVDLSLVLSSSNKYHFVPWSERSRVHGTMRLIRDSKIADGMAPVLKRALTNEDKDQVPRSVRATLRDYQIDGKNWLVRMISSGSGGILADAMGLGKTIQAITAFMEMRESDPKYRAIVFVPTSLTVNWQREFEKFAPSVSVLIWEGANRKKKTELLAKCDVTIVPYSVYMRDYDLINRFPYNVAYYDEAQWMKNPDTATHKAAIRCLAPTRIAMTGTPVENHLRDLHSIMAIACPGLLPSAKEFDEKIAKPYKNGDSRAVKIMAEQIRPFTLRRTQEQVLGEMPEKTIIDHVCPMTDKQAEYYEAVREQSARDRDSAISDGNKSALNALYLKLLTRLRRTATDPRLADPLGDFRAEDSGKMLALKAIMSGIEEDETNKCLIFSQWTDCLDLIRQDLEQRGEKFCYLTGDTKDRQGEVDRFQDEKGGIRYFLMSLKAGGVGLNITAANFVVIMDPWWNPAIESQATARAHRFGQKRAVTVYRLIAQDTLEEKIAMRKDLKQALADGIVDDKAIPTMSVDEMGGLLD